MIEDSDWIKLDKNKYNEYKLLSMQCMRSDLSPFIPGSASFPSKLMVSLKSHDKSPSSTKKKLPYHRPCSHDKLKEKIPVSSVNSVTLMSEISTDHRLNVCEIIPVEYKQDNFPSKVHPIETLCTIEPSSNDLLTGQKADDNSSTTDSQTKGKGCLISSDEPFEGSLYSRDNFAINKECVTNAMVTFQYPKKIVTDWRHDLSRVKWDLVNLIP